MTSRASLAVVVAVTVIAMAAAAVALESAFGPTDNGVRCTRSATVAECHVLRTRFFGVAGNSSLVIPESVVRDAEIQCATGGSGGHRGSSCAVYLHLDSGPPQLVASYALRSQAVDAARELNTYFGDKSLQSVAIDDKLLTPIILYALVPIAIVALVLALRARQRRT